MLVLLKRISILTMIGFFLGMFVEELNHDTLANSYIDELEDHWVQPVNGEITDTFGTRNGNHKGVDIAAPKGEEIVSVSDGKVTKSYYSDSYGHVVFIEHPEGYETVYAHLSKRNVSEGVTIKKGETVGIIGNTGISTGTHLHFELHKGEWTYDKTHALDPLFVFGLPNSNVTTDHTHGIDSTESVISEHSFRVSEEKKQTIKTKVQSSSGEKAEDNQVGKEQRKVVKVTKGDTLWGISQTFKVTIKSLKEWNKLNSDTIYPGQEITVYLNKEKSYVVQAGDTIQSIAKEFRVAPESLKEANQLENEMIFPMQVLSISK